MEARVRRTRAESRDHTRHMLRDAAVREFARNGFAGTSAESIAAVAGFSGGAFYSNYRSKQDILVDVMRTLQTAESEEWERVISEGGTVEDILAKLAKRAERFSRRQEWLLMRVEMELRAARNAAFKREYATYRAELRQLALRTLTGLYAKAGKRIPDDVELVADAWLAFSVGIGLYFVAESQSKSRAALRTAIFVPLLQSLLARAEPLSAQES